MCVCPSFPFGIEGELWDPIVLILGICLSIYFTQVNMSNVPTENAGAWSFVPKPLLLSYPCGTPVGRIRHSGIHRK